MRYWPKQKKRGKRSRQSRSNIHCKSHVRVVGRKKRGNSADYHPKGCSRRVSYFQLHGSSDKFAAIPPTRGRLNGKEVTDCSNCKHRPTGYAVIKFKIFHSNYFIFESAKIHFFLINVKKKTQWIFFLFFLKKSSKKIWKINKKVSIFAPENWGRRKRFNGCHVESFEIFIHAANGLNDF